jgi:FlaG/FlaF family flagellin (archaellin)
MRISMILNLKNNKYSISAIIGVILSVAIVVGIAVVVNVYLNTIINEPPRQTPVIAFVADSSNNKLSVSSVDDKISWDDVQLKTDNSNSVLLFNGNTSSQKFVGQNWTTVSPINFGNDVPTYISSGNYFNFTSAVSGNIIISFRYIPTNTLIGTWTVSV